ncbi:hypothetical protein [Dickeya chrysanthemi]|uniref:hypothetical protein n=1 Tax=Dickeya chrysanthemi TaxID=556 RepID=UPI001CF30F8C|nr:hypothetical protein [Dickeya chrysanthemi]MCA7009432.1 hypothetical protein [Dickeya chrysanthemi]
MKEKNINMNTFLLLVAILIISFGPCIVSMSYQKMKTEQEAEIAKSVAQQTKEIGEAVDKYVNTRYEKLSTLTSSSGQSGDPGHRICNSTGCEITYQTLINEGLLPVSYVGVNSKNATHRIFLKRDDNMP